MFVRKEVFLLVVPYVAFVPQGEAANSLGRFPPYGSEEHRQRCSWVYNYHAAAPYSCTFHIAPVPGSGEGLAQWISMVATGFVYAAQVNCRLAVDYGPTVDLRQIFEQPEAATSDTTKGMRWYVPSDFVCKESDGCYNIGSKTILGLGLGENRLRTLAARHYPDQREEITAKAFGRVPYYRSAYSREGNETSAVQHLEEVLPGFEYDSGFGCALTSLFELSKSAEQFIPGLFEAVILPLSDPKTLVITVYIRTGRTDRIADKERGMPLSADTEESINSDFDPDVQHLVDCAKQTERDRFNTDGHNDIIWLVISDNPNVAGKVAKEYSTVVSIEQKDGKQRHIQRKVITTQAQGVQSRPARDPSTSDFADAVLDWHLIGLSDAVISHGVTSFVTTGALRTNRPLYTAMKGECLRRELDNDGSAVVEGHIQASIRPGQKINLVQLLKAQQRAKKKQEEEHSEL